MYQVRYRNVVKKIVLKAVKFISYLAKSIKLTFIWIFHPVKYWTIIYILLNLINIDK